MKTSDFDFNLPNSLIAQIPSKNRGDSRMLVINRKNNSITHHYIKDLTNFLDSKDILVFNDTKVIPARLFGNKKTGGKIEILLLNENEENEWNVLIKSSRKPKINDEFMLCDGSVYAKVIGFEDNGSVLIKINCDKSFLEIINLKGYLPLPPYIKRNYFDKNILKIDNERYQTIFANKLGAVAAPTAGLHFTTKLINEIKSKGVQQTFVTLHVGLGTFRPVNTESIYSHKMHSEWFEITRTTANKLNNIKKNNGKIFAVGSTCVRTLESQKEICAHHGETDIFIRPPHNFKHVDAIVTNFHLPKSSLLMMMSAFTGYDLLMRAYEEAIKQKYRFYSYGDCMLIL